MECTEEIEFPEEMEYYPEKIGNAKKRWIIPEGWNVLRGGTPQRDGMHRRDEKN